MTDQQQTPEDDRTELSLRALIPLLANSAYPEFNDVRSMRDGVPSHTFTAASEALTEVSRRFSAHGGGITERANALLGQRLNSNGRPDPNGTLWAEIIRRALVAAEDDELVPGLFTSMWKDLCANASA